MFFGLKKLISFWIMPLQVSVVLMLVGLWLVLRRRRERLGRRLLVAGVGVLLFFSHNFVSAHLVQSLESRYAPIPELTPGATLPAELARCRNIVVLGGGNGDVATLSATSKLSPNSLGRIVEGVRLLRLLPDARLIVSGPAVGNSPTHASVLARAAVSLGTDPQRIVQIDTALDTEDEAFAVRKIVGDEPVALVTSAWHMPRAAALFRKAGVNALPCPTDFLGKPNPGWRWNDVLFDSGSLDNSTLAVHERLGLLWAWLTRKI
jgi:uncharacterized SAM-binding protein YcdF (DUF218 family)